MEINQCPLTEDEKMHMISEAAYYRSKNRGSLPSNPTDDWTSAKAEFEQAMGQQCTRQKDNMMHGFLLKTRSKIIHLFEKAGEFYPKDVESYWNFWH